MSKIGFLEHREVTDEVTAFFEDDIADRGYVMNLSKLWAYQPGTNHALSALMQAAIARHDLDVRQRGILIAACASAIGDSYCSVAWGGKLAKESDAEIFAITVFVALRLAFSTVNDALGACPDAELRSTVPEAVVDAVTFGRPIA